MILKNYVYESASKSHPLGELSSYLTEDGSLSLHSKLFKESFHNTTGAYTEAQKKFLLPAQLEQTKDKKTIAILDVCVGLGYNSGCLIEELLGTSKNLIWWGLEIDMRPLEIAINNHIFRSMWSPKVLKIFEELSRSGEWEQNSSKGKILWGDARQKISLLPKGLSFDLILLDPFSPNQCPALWSEEFLLSLAKRLVKGGRITTYCRAAAVRSSLRRAGLDLKSLTPNNPEDIKEWSNGTLAINIESIDPLTKKDSNWQPLSLMEEEHLLTCAAVPYRDLTGQDTKKQILKRRQEEQQNCKMESTTAWKKRWKN